MKTVNFYLSPKEVYFCLNYLYSNKSIGYVETWPKCLSDNSTPKGGEASKCFSCDFPLSNNSQKIVYCTTTNEKALHTLLAHQSPVSLDIWRNTQACNSDLQDSTVIFAFKGLHLPIKT